MGHTPEVSTGLQPDHDGPYTTSKASKQCKNIKRKATILAESYKVIERVNENKNNFYKSVRNKTTRREQLWAIQKQDGTVTKCDQEKNSKKCLQRRDCRQELKDVFQNKSVCSEDVKMSISSEEIIAAIKSIEEGKDEVSTSVLLGYEQDMLIHLLIIFNNSYDKSKMP